MPGKNSEKQPVKTATMTVYTFTDWKLWFRNYYIAHAFVVRIKINNELEELGFNAVVLFEFCIGLDAVRSAGILSSYLQFVYSVQILWIKK